MYIDDIKQGDKTMTNEFIVTFFNSLYERDEEIGKFPTAQEAMDAGSSVCKTSGTTFKICTLKGRFATVCYSRIRNCQGGFTYTEEVRYF